MSKCWTRWKVPSKTSSAGSTGELARMAKSPTTLVRAPTHCALLRRTRRYTTQLSNQVQASDHTSVVKTTIFVCNRNSNQKPVGNLSRMMPGPVLPRWAQRLPTGTAMIVLALLAVTLIGGSNCSAWAFREDVCPSRHSHNQSPGIWLRHVFQQSGDKININAVTLSNKGQDLTRKGLSVKLRASYLRVPSRAQVAAATQRCVRLAWARCQDARRRSAELFANFRVPRAARDSEAKRRLGEIVAAAAHAFGQVLHARSCSEGASEPLPKKVVCSLFFSRSKRS